MHETTSGNAMQRTTTERQRSRKKPEYWHRSEKGVEMHVEEVEVEVILKVVRDVRGSSK